MGFQMQLPSLPTDNLYKFIALSGLVLLVTAIVVPVKIQDEIDKDFARLVLIQQVKIDLAVLEWNQAGSPPKTLTTEEAIEKWRSSQKEKKEELQSRLRKLEVSGADAEFEYYSAIRVRKRWRRIAYCIGAIGILLMCIGFRLWYVRLQKYQDKIIRRQAELDKSED